MLGTKGVLLFTQIAQEPYQSTFSHDSLKNRQLLCTKWWSNVSVISTTSIFSMYFLKCMFWSPETQLAMSWGLCENTWFCCLMVQGWISCFPLFGFLSLAAGEIINKSFDSFCGTNSGGSSCSTGFTRYMEIIPKNSASVCPRWITHTKRRHTGLSSEIIMRSQGNYAEL